MKLTMRARGIDLTDELRLLVMRRVRFSLTRQVAPATRVSVALFDVNGPRGGRDKRVLLRVLEPGLTERVIQEDGDDLVTTLDRAVDRMARSCARERERARLLAIGARAPRRSPSAA